MPKTARHPSDCLLNNVLNWEATLLRNMPVSKMKVEF